MIILIVLIVLIPSIFVLAKYINIKKYDSYLKSKEFYFTSNILDIVGSTHSINNWNGIDYTLDVDIENYLNDLAWSNYDIDYDVEYTCPSNVNCSLLTPTSDTLTYNPIKKTNNSIKLFIESKEENQFDVGDSIELSLSATSKSKYEKKIFGNFKLKVSSYGINYSIVDSPNNYYMTLKINNTTDVNKNVHLSFNNNLVRIDNLNSKVLSSTLYKDSNDIINGIDLVINSSEEMVINFYKEDITNDYTYPLVNDSSVIEIS